MHEQKEKRRCFHHRTTHDDDDDEDERCQVGSIPLDLTSEILSRLPAKSIFRFLCVSKLWSSFIKLPSFIKTFTTHSSARPPSLVVTFSLSRERFVFLFPQQENLNGSYPPFYSYQMTDARNAIWQHAQSECVQGLVLFRGFVIWNQTMRRFLNLPLPEPERSNEGEGASYLGRIRPIGG